MRASLRVDARSINPWVPCALFFRAMQCMRLIIAAGHITKADHLKQLEMESFRDNQAIESVHKSSTRSATIKQVRSHP